MAQLGDNSKFRRPDFRLYIDETGNHDLQNVSDINNRFLCLTGVIIDREYYRHRLGVELDALKTKYFPSHGPDNPVIFHRKDMMNAKWPFDQLRNASVRQAFDKELLSHIAEWKYTVLSVCIDKKRHKEKYTVWNYEPYHYCLKLIIERYLLFLERIARSGDVMAESRGKREDNKLKTSFSKLCRDGTEYISAARIQSAITSSSLKLEAKGKNIPGLQLADLIAHPSMQEILIKNQIWSKGLAPFAKKITAILASKYDQDDYRLFGVKFIQ